MSYIKKLILIFYLLFPMLAQAEFDWVSFTLDNDFFLNYDNGYTNGFFISLYSLQKEKKKPSPSLILKPLIWSMPKGECFLNVNSYTLGQVIITPEDLTLKKQNNNEAAYAGLVFLNNSYLSVSSDYADKISTIIGIVGPLSRAEQTQKTIHKMLGAKKPQGWDTQLENKFVFEFTRARAWRAWHSDKDNFDIITTSELTLGNLSSSIGMGMFFRFGMNLSKSYATTLYNNTRTTNPLSVKKGDWNIYMGTFSKYVFNDILSNGDTLKDSHSINYKHIRVGALFGLSYAWSNYSLSFAINDMNIAHSKLIDELEQYGTLTFAMKL